LRRGTPQITTHVQAPDQSGVPQKLGMLRLRSNRCSHQAKTRTGSPARVSQRNEVLVVEAPVS
jgi:hypothetical protein